MIGKEWRIRRWLKRLRCRLSLHTWNSELGKWEEWDGVTVRVRRCYRCGQIERRRDWTCQWAGSVEASK